MNPDAPRPEDPHFDRARFEMRSDGAKEEHLEQNPLRSGVHNRGYLPHVNEKALPILSRFGSRILCLARC